VTVPVYPWTVWIVAALDPILIGLALYLGYTASQFGKVFIAAIIALAVSVLASWAITAVGIPWPAPISHDGPTFFPVRWIAGFLWGTLGFLAHQLHRLRA